MSGGVDDGRDNTVGGEEEMLSQYEMNDNHHRYDHDGDDVMNVANNSNQLPHDNGSRDSAVSPTAIQQKIHRNELNLCKTPSTRTELMMRRVDERVY
jgi:hypothetical protein